MNSVERLLKQLKARGLDVRPGVEPGQLVLCGPREAKTPEVVEAVKAFKPLLLQRVGAAGPVGPAAEPAVADNGEGSYVVRRGECRARADVRLCWASFAAGGRHRFEERRIPNGHTTVTSYRVFAGRNSGYAGPTTFRDAFEELP